jgi:Ca-activated chloride channel family protein
MKKISLLIAVAFITLSTFAQVRTISGVVSDDAGPIADISVNVIGTSNGTVTDFDGNYAIKAKIGDIIKFSHISYKTVKKTVGKNNTIDVTMTISGSILDEVVIVGAYNLKAKRLARKQRRKNRRNNNRPNASVVQTLQGHSNGLYIQSGSGQPGANNAITLRGVGSINVTREPLFIVDGVPVSESKFKQIKNTKIASVSILKNANASAIYGSRGSNGAIIITTKSGKSKIDNNEKSLFIVDGKELSFKAYSKIDPNKIKAYQILKNKALINLYGEKAKNGVISITTHDVVSSDNESYESIIENQFERVAFAPLSTFSIDVDKASYSNIRRFINNGQEVPSDAVKIEEMINYFNYNYAQPTDEHPFSIQSEVALSPNNKTSKIVKIGIQGKNVATDKIPASNLVFLIDVSGSMSDMNKLPLLKSAFKLLVKQLRNKDKVSIVVYAGAAGLVLEPTSGDDKNKILQALDNLEAGGSTAGGAGINLAYKIAQQNFIKGGNNRIILATDGDFNVGASSNKSMEDLIVEKRKSGVFLTCLGFGMGNYKDSKLETLADKGNGNHAYIDSMQEAKRVLGTEFGGTLYTIAKDVKIQVEFNPNKVQAYRLIGYENRLLKDEDFTDDKKDAGELGSNHNVTALYEVIPVGVKSAYLKKLDDLKYTKNNETSDFKDELLTVKFRYKKPDGDKSIEMVHIVKNSETYFNNASDDFKFSTAVALFGMKLRHSKFAKNVAYNDIAEIAISSKGEDKNTYRSEFIRLVETVKAMN